MKWPRQLFFRHRRYDDLAVSIHEHLEEKIDELIEDGMSRKEATRTARREFGNVTLIEERSREEWQCPKLESIWEDLKYALRQLLQAPGFTVTVILTLALGIGANTAIFSVVNAVLQHPAGVDHPERIAVLNTHYTQFNLDIPDVSVPVFAKAASLENQVEAAAIESSTNFNILHDGIAEHISAARVSWKWFQVFGATPILGRTFVPDEDQPNAGQVAVLSYGAWQSIFGGQRDVIGRSLLLDSKSYRIVGVMRNDFAWPRSYQIWVPIALPESAFAPKQVFNENYQTVLRLRPGLTIQQFNAEIATKMWEELRQQDGSRYATSSGWSVYAVKLTEFAAGSLRKPLYVLFGVVVLVLLIAAANVAGLVLARGSARSREFAIRAALGASVGRMMQQLFIEMLLLACLATCVGVAAGPALGRLLLLMVPQRLAEGFIVRTDLAVLIFTAGMALMTSLIVGLVPAFRMMRQYRRLELHDGGRSATVSLDKQRLRRIFVIGEIALAYLLLVGTGLFLVNLGKLQQGNTGFNSRGLLAGKVQYAGEEFKKNQQAQAAFVRGTVDRLALQPGVRAAAAVEPLPFDPEPGGSNTFDIEGNPKNADNPEPHSHLTYATPDYLTVMQIPLLAGRWFTDDDRKTAPRVVVIDQRLAHKYWPNQNPIGQHLDSDSANGWATVVGIVGNIRSDSLETDTTDGMRYYPFAQVDDLMANFLVRTDGAPGRLAPAIKQAVNSVDPSQAVSTITSVETLVSDSLAGRRLIAWMLTAFASLALLLAVIGIYALISYVTTQRTSEIGIRMALGAQRSSILHLVLWNALSWVAIGLAVGSLMSLLASALLNRLFAGFGGSTVSSLLAAAMILIIVGGLAGLIPARRMASLDPMRALRAE